MKKILSALFLSIALALPGYADGTARTNKFTPDVSQHSQSMIVTCVVKSGDAVLSDCELAAFDEQDNCRGSQLSLPDQNGMIYLMVYGTATEKLHFKAVKSDGTVYDCVEQFSFATDGVVGDLITPYVFTLKLCDINKDGKQSLADLTALVHILKGGRPHTVRHRGCRP